MNGDGDGDGSGSWCVFVLFVLFVRSPIVRLNSAASAPVARDPPLTGLGFGYRILGRNEGFRKLELAHQGVRVVLGRLVWELRQGEGR